MVSQYSQVSQYESAAFVTIFGGSGFVGRYTVRELARRGWRIRAASRRPDLAGYLQPMGDVGQVTAVQANLRYPESVRRAVEGASAVVISVGVLASQGKQTFEALHVEGPRTAARAAREAGVRRLVHISALGADAQSNSRYARTKAQGEEAVLAEFPEAVILRPSVIFGPEDDFFNRFGSMAQISPVLPLIGGGRTKFQPVYVGDVASAVAQALNGAAKPGTVYELGGPEVLTFRELMDRTQEYAERKRFYVSLPFWCAKINAALTWPLPNSLRPITVDQVRLLEHDNVVSEEAIREGRTLAGLGVEPLSSISSIVPAYLERFRPRGQYSRYRG